MSKPVNPTLIGAFVVGAIILVVSAIIVFGGETFTRRERVIMYFSGSVDGLDVGAPVNVRGVQIGTVTQINILFNTETGDLQVPVIAEIDANSINQVRQLKAEDPLRAIVEDLGLRAQLRIQSILTSKLYIHLDYFPESEIRYLGNGSIIEIPTIPSPLERIDKALNNISIEQMLADIFSAVSAISKLANSTDVADTMKSMREALDNVNTLSRDFLPLAKNANQVIVEAHQSLAELQRVLKDAKSLIGVDSPYMLKLDAALTEINNAARTVSQLENLPQMQKLNGALDEISGAARTIRTLEDSRQMYNLDIALEEIIRAAQAVRILADTLERQPEALFKGKSTRE